MPTRPPSRCPWCKGRRKAGVKCETCYPMFSTSAWATTLTRPNARRWGIVRMNYLATHSLCQWQGCKAVAHEVDHKLNLKDHPEVDPFDYKNLQALCSPHHRIKTGGEGARASALAVKQRLKHGRPRRPR